MKGATTATPPIVTAEASFNSRSREGSDKPSLKQSLATSRFNSRSREGSDLGQRYALFEYTRFNSRSREGSDKSRASEPLLVPVVSIHAPVKGATKRAHSVGVSLLSFNSRSREGSDRLGDAVDRLQ